MSTLTGKIVADFTTTLATAMAVGATSVSLQSATDDDSVALPAGRYFFAIDGNNSSKEHISCTLSGTSLTSIKSLSRQGVETSGVVRAHRVGATVTLTDFAHIKFINDLVAGTTTFNASVPLGYDGTASITTDNQLATKAYVDGVAIAGAAKATDSVYGITKLSVAAASGTAPIAVGDNDNRVSPVSLASVTANRVAALVGTGTPSSTDTFVNLSTITGAIVMWGTTSAPTGWLLCDGSAVSRTGTNAALFAIIGTTYGTGNGTTTFNLPNLKGSVPVGYDSGQTEFNTMGKTGGEKTHVLTIAELASHNHTAQGYTIGGGGSTGLAGSAGGVANVTGTTASTGSDTAHNNLQPYITLSYIIKI